MTVDVVLRIRRDVEPVTDEAGRVVLARGYAELRVGPLGDAADGALRGAGATEAELGALLAGAAGAAGEDVTGVAVEGADLVARLDAGGWLERVVRLDGAPLASLRPTANLPVARAPVPAPGAKVLLSRFAVLHREGTEVVVESPRSGHLVALHDPRLGALVAGLDQPRDAADLERWGLPPAALAAVTDLLARAGLLVGVEDGRDEEEADPALAQWSLADLLFHARSRQGRHARGYGPTYPLRGRSPLPPMAVPLEGEPIELARPEPATRPGTLFDEVLDRRQSVREHDESAPITSAQLGEFLYRAARVRPELTAWADGTARPPGSARPYPTGGALYELELYPVVRACTGLGGGLYRYDPFGHRLGRVAGMGPRVQRFVEDGRRKSEMALPPQVVLVITARFGRTMWKYESIAYALVLKDVGVLYQTMYLVATSMGLAACGIGGGDSDAFGAAAGLDYYDQSSVGEFLLGSRAVEPS